MSNDDVKFKRGDRVRHVGMGGVWEVVTVSRSGNALKLGVVERGATLPSYVRKKMTDLAVRFTILR